MNGERLTILRDARTAWHELTTYQSRLYVHDMSRMDSSQPHNLNSYAKQITHLEANPANHYHRAYRHRHYFWGAVVPLN